MYTDVYADVLFLINFSMDGIALYITARLCAMRAKASRLAIASTVGAMYSVASVFWEFAPIIEIAVTVLVCVLMVCAAFPVRSTGEIVKNSVVMFVASSLLGGVMSASYSVANDLIGKYMHRDNADAIDPVLFSVLACVSMAAGVFLTHLHGSGDMPSRAEITVVLFEKRITTEGIVDSGNLLKDPLSGKHVILIRAEYLSGVLSSQFISGAISSDMNTPYRLPQREKARFRLVPAKSVGDGVYLYGVLPECVYINYEKGKKRNTVERDAVIAIAPDLAPDIKCVIPQSII